MSDWKAKMEELAMSQAKPHRQELADMTPETAIARLRIIADLGNLPASSKHQLRLVADWMETIQFSLPDDWAERAEWENNQREACEAAREVQNVR